MKNVEFKKIFIENKQFNVVSYDSFVDHKDINMNNMTAVEYNGYVYPVRNQTDTKPGIYNAGCIDFFVHPGENNKEYSVENINDIGNSKDIGEYLNAMNDVNMMERHILTSPDNIYVANISDKDSPAMKGLKQAINDKQIDINKYQDRFGRESFPNDKRNLKSHDITLFMLDRYAKALDIKCTLILENKDDDIANPMSEPITIDLTNYDNN